MVFGGFASGKKGILHHKCDLKIRSNVLTPQLLSRLFNYHCSFSQERLACEGSLLRKCMFCPLLHLWKKNSQNAHNLPIKLRPLAKESLLCRNLGSLLFVFGLSPCAEELRPSPAEPESSRLSQHWFCCKFNKCAIKNIAIPQKGKFRKNRKSRKFRFPGYSEGCLSMRSHPQK